jgi:hypothetical protein
VPKSALERLREICLALPDTGERLSHGTPYRFAGKRNFASCWDGHHEDGRLAPVPLANIEATVLPEGR